MVTPPHLCLLVALFLPALLAMPEPIPEQDWEPPAGSPLIPPSFPSGNTTDPLPGSMEAYCQMLLQTAGSTDQIPWFCLCTHCQSNQGPKGDRGDRGLQGTQDDTTVRLISYMNRNETLLYLSLTQVPQEVLEEGGPQVSGVLQGLWVDLG